MKRQRLIRAIALLLAEKFLRYTDKKIKADDERLSSENEPF